ncbi:HNH endonuclease [Anaerostipes caccae]|uniref:HNH endonuclease n=1 Tax=Anaerostipes caccae TaxID=105841 RepID=UPI0038D39C92
MDLEEYVENYEELNKKIKTDDKLLRIAILEAYEYICHYEGIPITYENFDIDHIIPKENSNSENQEDWKRLKSTLKLPSDFELNGILNYVPAGERFNRVRKGNKKLSQSAIEADLRVAKSKANRVFSIMKKLKGEREVDQAKNVLSEFIINNPDARLEILNELTGNGENEDLLMQSDNYQKIIKSLKIFRNHIAQMTASEKDNYLKSFETTYEPKKNVTKEEFNIVRSQVQIKAFAPKAKSYLPNYLITFTKITLSDMMLTPDYEYTKNYLFKKVFSDDVTKRGFWAADYYGHEENVFLQVGNARFDVLAHTAVELSEIVDEYYIWYSDFLIEIERERGTLGAQLFTEDRYVIAEVGEDIWKILSKYISQGIKRISKEKMRLEQGWMGYLKFWIGNEIVLCLTHKVINNRAYILWENNFGTSYMGEYWDFKKASDWFFEELLPILFELNEEEVEKIRRGEENLFNKIRCFICRDPIKDYSNELYGFKFQIEFKDLRKQHLFIDIREKIQSDEYIKIVQNLQYFYDIDENWKNIYLNDKQICNFFEAMLIILKKEGVQTHPNYLAGNLGFIDNGFRDLKMEDLILEIEKVRVNLPLLNDYGICFAIRNIRVASEDCELPFTSDEIRNILRDLEPLIEFYNRSNVIEKFGKHLKTEVLDGF